MEEDIRLIEAVRNGNRPAFRQLVERYQHYVFTVTYRVLKSREEAEEAAQDTFIKVYNTLHTFEKKAKFSTWLYTIAYRTAIDVARKKQLHTDSIDDEASFLQIKDQEKTPVQRTQERDLQLQLQEIIQQLKPEEATLITLFYLNEKSVKEIAEITGLTITNIKTKLHRTREALRELLQVQLREEVEDML